MMICPTLLQQTKKEEKEEIKKTYRLRRLRILSLDYIPYHHTYCYSLHACLT